MFPEIRTETASFFYFLLCLCFAKRGPGTTVKEIQLFWHFLPRLNSFRAASALRKMCIFLIRRSRWSGAVL